MKTKVPWATNETSEKGYQNSQETNEAKLYHVSFVKGLVLAKK